jgi:hypothetical protein
MTQDCDGEVPVECVHSFVPKVVDPETTSTVYPRMVKPSFVSPVGGRSGSVHDSVICATPSTPERPVATRDVPACDMLVATTNAAATNTTLAMSLRQIFTEFPHSRCVHS